MSIRQPSEPLTVRQAAMRFLSKPVTVRERILSEVLGQTPPPEEHESMRQIRERGLVDRFVEKMGAE